MRKFALYSLAILLTTIFSCKKDRADSSYDVCDSRRATILTATNLTGSVSYYNNLDKWAVNVSIPGTIDGVRTCILCNNIADSLKSIGRVVTFSGDLKATYGIPEPQTGGQEIYYVAQIDIR